MGQSLTRLRGTLVTRPLQRFNIEGRTEKRFDKDMVERAPYYPSDREILAQMKESNPNFAQEEAKKDDQLYDRLKTVYVSSKDPDSFDPESLKQIENPERPLPKRSYFPSEPFHPFHLPKNVRRLDGKLTLSEMEAILGRRSQDSSYGAQEIAEEYKLKLEDTEALLRYYGVFSVVDNSHVKPVILDNPLLAKPDWEEVEHEPLRSPTVKQIGPSK
ncbi:hypothetical protein TCAL_08202 [Tigriopus californicus]|uniref:Uncharacterized protein n=1 Tax=Tigriopus californicus TaxID=6832 RepID=A0A553NDM4_TIGCA|nr:NADH dehydrogenase [ubiquinone] 1 alpha subcomplex assembly factor 4-like [Tigriopus californicus]TRY63552.1 hypothetical protein TCAL_08202 [Tigriopus californicus]|eukprot:TCALIF_08202-PA protein Name:"Similar to Ndufaf4 NADH dehydrogenase [ubiquinone] 1 alpha subcomplex assembly factor 4 (Rattus norvegicus)" AED:0.00 eAED:0.00 QI:110/1/1/1/1/1/2/6/215